MKLAFSTLPCEHWSFEETMKVCQGNGIDAIEIRMGLNEWSSLELTKEQCEEMVKLCHRYGIVISDLGTSVVVKGYDSNALEELEVCAKIANWLKVKGLRIMLGYFKNRWSDEVPDIDYEGVIGWLRKASEIASATGTEIWIETHNEFTTGRVLRKLLDDANIPHCKLIWDIIHPLEQGETVEQTIAYMGDDLVHLHVKDGKPWDDTDLANWKYTKIGEGVIPIKEIIDLLESKGYKGYYSLEWESKWKKEIQGEEYTAEIIIPEYSKWMKELKK